MLTIQRIEIAILLRKPWPPTPGASTVSLCSYICVSHLVFHLSYVSALKVLEGGGSNADSLGGGRGWAVGWVVCTRPELKADSCLNNKMNYVIFISLSLFRP